MTDEQSILSIICADNEAWTSGKLADGPEAMYADNAVLVAPGFGVRIEGRDEIRRSYEQFVKAAAVVSFEEADQHVDVHGGTAVATYRFSIRYRIGEETHDERGHEVLVFVRGAQGWRVLWRTQVREA